jgi:hypothetical protein
MIAKVDLIGLETILTEKCELEDTPQINYNESLSRSSVCYLRNYVGTNLEPDYHEFEAIRMFFK